MSVCKENASFKETLWNAHPPLGALSTRWHGHQRLASSLSGEGPHPSHATCQSPLTLQSCQWMKLRSEETMLASFKSIYNVWDNLLQKGWGLLVQQNLPAHHFLLATAKNSSTQQPGWVAAPSSAEQCSCCFYCLPDACVRACVVCLSVSVCTDMLLLLAPQIWSLQEAFKSSHF